MVCYSAAQANLRILHVVVTFGLKFKGFLCKRRRRDDIFRIFCRKAAFGCILKQGRRQEFFQGRALRGSRGGLPSHFSISRAQPRFLVASMVKMKEFLGQGGHGPPCLCLPTPLYLSLPKTIKFYPLCLWFHICFHRPLSSQSCCHSQDIHRR